MSVRSFVGIASTSKVNCISKLDICNLKFPDGFLAVNNPWCVGQRAWYVVSVDGKGQTPKTPNGITAKSPRHQTQI